MQSFLTFGFPRVRRHHNKSFTSFTMSPTIFVDNTKNKQKKKGHQTYEKTY